MKKYLIEEFARRNFDDVLKIEFRPKELVEVELHDGSKVITKGRHIRVLWPFWEWNRVFNYPISKDLISGPDVWLDPKECNRLLTAGLHETLRAHPQLLPYDIQGIGLDIAEMFTNAVFHYAKHVGTIDNEDYLEVNDDPEIADAKAHAATAIQLEASGAAKYRIINDAHKTIVRRLGEGQHTVFQRNNLSLMVNMGILKIGQLKQAILKGFLTDIDSSFAPYPVLPGFFEGLRDTYEALMESCSGAKAQYFTTEPVQDTEYTNRQIQQVAVSFQRIHAGDCGSTITYDAVITDEDELKRFNGKNVIFNGKLTEIDAKSDYAKTMVGKVVKVRGIAGCIHPDASGCCATCLGGISRSIPYNVMAGHVMATELFAAITQKVISVKHEDTSSVSEVFSLAQEFIPFFAVNDDGRTIDVAHYTKQKGVVMGFRLNEVRNIAEIDAAEDLTDLNLGHISQLQDVFLWYKLDDGSEQELSMKISKGKKAPARLTLEFLEYLKAHPEIKYVGHVGNEQILNILYDKIPDHIRLFELPFKHVSMLDLHRRIDVFFQSEGAKSEDDGRVIVVLKDDDVTLQKQHSFPEAINAFNDLIKDNFTVNQAVLEATIWPYTVRNPDEYDYFPVKGTNKCRFGKLKDIINWRSLSCKLIHERQYEMYESPDSYLLTNRLASPYDAPYVKDLGTVNGQRLSS